MIAATFGVRALCSSAMAALLLPCSLQAQLYKITGATPVPIASNTTGPTLTVTGTLPTNVGPNGGLTYCFFAASGLGTKPIVPTSTAPTVINIPATTVQNIPIGSYVNGVYQVTLYINQSPSEGVGTCDGDPNPNVTNSILVPISLVPNVTSYKPGGVPQKNPATGVEPPPYTLNFVGTGFAANTTANFSWTGGSGAGIVHVVSSTSAVVTLPTTIPASVSSISPSVCNGTFCANAPAIIFTQLTASAGTLTAAPNPATVNQPSVLTAQFKSGPSDVQVFGAPSGNVTFTSGGTAIGTGRLVLDKTAALTATSTANVSATTPELLHSGNFNGDGIPDIVYFDTSNPLRLHVLVGTTPYGSFQPETLITLPTACAFGNTLATGDLNNDGFADIVVNCSDANQAVHAYTLLSNGDGTFAAAVAMSNVFGAQIALSDINRDGKLDLVVQGALTSPTTTCPGICPTGFALFTGNGDGTFTAAGTVATSVLGYQAFVMADIDKDGYPDIVALEGNNGAQNTVDILLSHTGKTFGVVAGASSTPSATVNLLGTPNFYRGIAVGDFNGDGLIDIAATFVGDGVPALNGASIALNTSTVGSASFSTATTLSVAANVSSAMVADLNGDGILDLVFPTGTGSPVFYEGDGTGNFANTYSSFSILSGTITAVLPIDMNSDGDADVVVQTQTSGSLGSVTSYITTGSASASVSYTPTAAATVALAAAWPGNVDFTGSSANLSLTVNGVPTSVALSTSGTPTEYGQPVTFTAVVIAANANGAQDAGSVTFFDGQQVLQTVSPTGNGVAVLTTSALARGAHTITASYNGAAAYAASGSNTLTQTITQAPSIVSWTPVVATITYGTALSAAQLNAVAASKYVATVPGTFIYTPAAGTVPAAGANQILKVTFTPNDGVNFAATTGTATITVTKATPTIAWNTPGAITYGTALSATQLNATATSTTGALPGIYTYTPAAGTILKAGANQTLSVLFTPNDGADYNTATQTTTITVNKAAPTVTWNTPTAITYGTALSATQLNAAATGTGVPLPGTYTYTPALGTILGAGSNQALAVVFTPTDTVDYNTANGTTIMTVGKATPTITWASPSGITYGTALSATQLNATAAGVSGALGGTFAYTPAVGTVLTAGGAQPLAVVFTPADATNYTTANGGTTIAVGKASATITWSSPAAIVVGTPLSATQLNATATGPQGAVGGTFAYTPAAGTVLAAGANQTLATVFTPVDIANYAVTNGTTNITVIPLGIGALSPTSASLGAGATTVTLSGTGFLTDSIVSINGVAAPTTYISPTSLSVTIPASSLLTVQTLKFIVTDPTQSQISAAANFSVLAPPIAVTFSGPSTTPPATQPGVNFNLANSYPVPITGVVTLTFNGLNGVDDPAIQFSTGGRTLTFTIPANSTTTPSIQLQTGTDAGTITVTLVLSAGGQVVTPASVVPIAITEAPAVPSITSMTLVRSGNTITANIIGYSNPRDLAQAVFTFTGANGVAVDTPTVTIPATAIFSAWFTNVTSQPYGSIFLYSQDFNLTNSASSIGSVTVTLTNSVGTSTSLSAQ
jgi:hypothetical protein